MTRSSRYLLAAMIQTIAIVAVGSFSVQPAWAQGGSGPRIDAVRAVKAQVIEDLATLRLDPAESGARRIDAMVAAEPGLGNYRGDAQALLAIASALRGRPSSPASPKTARAMQISLFAIGRSLTDQGGFVAAEQAYRLVIAADPRRIDGYVVLSLAESLFYQSRYEEAALSFTDAIARFEAMGRPADRDRADALMQLAALRGFQQRYGDGEALYRQALAVSQTSDDAAVGEVVRSNLAWNLHEQGRHAEAEPLLRQAIVDFRRREGPRTRNVAAATTNLAGELQAQGRDAEALPLFREALSIFEEAVGRGHPQAAWTLNAMARSTAVVEGPDAAEPLFREAVTLSRRRLPPGHPDIVQRTADLADFQIDAGRPSEALTTLRPVATELRVRATAPSPGRRLLERDRRINRLHVQAAWASGMAGA